MEDHPRYEHDCRLCVFLGQHGVYDLYICPNSEGNLGPSMIARSSDDDDASVSLFLLLDRPEEKLIQMSNESKADYFPAIFSAVHRARMSWRNPAVQEAVLNCEIRVANKWIERAKWQKWHNVDCLKRWKWFHPIISIKYAVKYLSLQVWVLWHN